MAGKMQSVNALNVKSVSKTGAGSLSNAGQMIAGGNMQLVSIGTLEQISGVSMKTGGSLIANSNQFINSGTMSAMMLTS